MDRVSSGQLLGDRDTQEDALAVIRQHDADEDGELLLVMSDGMGGHAGGEVASNLAVSTFLDHFQNVSTNMRPRGRLRDSVEAANRAIAQRIGAEPSLRGMGCTFIGVLVVSGRIIWCSVGDSVLFLFRDGQLRRLNADHSYFSELLSLVDKGEMTRAEAEAHPNKNALMSAMTGAEIKLMDLNVAEARPDDTIILATDGLETLGDPEIARIVDAQSRGGAEAIKAGLLKAVAARQRPRQDNTSVIVLKEAGKARSTKGAGTRWALQERQNNIVLQASVGAAVLGGLALAAYFLIGGDAAAPTRQIASPAPAPVIDPAPQAILEEGAPIAPVDPPTRPAPEAEPEPPVEDAEPSPPDAPVDEEAQGASRPQSRPDSQGSPDETAPDLPPSEEP